MVADRLPLPVEGTSCSSPIFAGVIAMLNGRRIAAGKSSLGFLNPLIYSDLAAALHDVTSSSADGCTEGDGDGFPAVKGWDAATGWGSPNYPDMVKVVDALH